MFFLLLIVSFALLPLLVSTLRPGRPDDALPACGTLDRFAAAYELLERVGRGRWGTVRKARERLTGDLVAVKDTAEEAEVLREYARLKDKRHPNIVRAHACFQGPGRAVMVMQYCAGGDLALLLYGASDGPASALPERWCRSICEQVLGALVYLGRDFGESHNDLKAENVLVAQAPEGPGLPPPLVLLGDFGASARAGARREGPGGDPRYAAPETARDGASLGFETDAWSLGILLHEMLAGGLLPFACQNTRTWRSFLSAEGGARARRYLAHVQGGHRPDLSQLEPAEARDLARGLLEARPGARLTAEEALEHPWVRQR